MDCIRRVVARVGALALTVSIALGMLALPGCKKSEPEPSAPGYYTGPIKPKGEVAPGPGAGAKPGSKPSAATGDL